MIEEKENVNGSDSGSDSGNDIGRSSASAGIGSGGSAGGDGGNVDGDGRNVSGSVDGTGTGTGADNGSGNADILDLESPNGTTDGDSNTLRGSRSERIRRTGSVRLGSAVRNSSTDGSGSGTGTGSAEVLDSEPVIRLGAKKQGKPRAETKTENTTDMKLSEMKDLISMFLDSIFEIPAAVMRQDFWRLNKDENKMLTDAVSAYIKSMPKDKSSWLMTFIQDNLPLVNLLMIGFFIVSDRVKGSIAIAQVTKGARFAETVSQNIRSNNGANTIRTPMDEMFS